MTARDRILTGCKRGLEAAIGRLALTATAEPPKDYATMRAATNAVMLAWKEYAAVLTDDSEEGRQELMF